MQRLILLVFTLLLLAVGCERVELKREVPSVPPESVQPLPR